jgi:hypothetical protein
MERGPRALDGEATGGVEAEEPDPVEITVTHVRSYVDFGEGAHAR